MPPVLWIGSRSARTHLAVGVGRVDPREVLGDGLAGHRQAVTVEQPGVEEGLHHDRHPSDAVDVGHDVGPERLDVREVGHPAADPPEVVDGEVDVGLVRHGQQVQHRVGRAAERHDDGDGVLERLLGHDLPGGDPAPQQLDHRLAGLPGEPVAPPVGRRRGRGTRHRHPDRLGHRGHGVRGVHAAARALAGADRPLDRVDVGARHLPRRTGADRLERVDDRDRPLRAVGELGDPREDRARIQEDGREVEARGGHEHARQGLVAAGQQDRAVQPLGHHHRLDRVGDDLARDQREVHSLVPHGDAVGHRDGPELQGVPARREHAVLDGAREPVEGQVARRDLVPRAGDPDLRLGEVVVAHPDGPEHSPRGGLLETVRDVAAPGLQVGRR